MKVLAALRDQILDELITGDSKGAILPWGYWNGSNWGFVEFGSSVNVYRDPMWPDVSTLLREELQSLDPNVVEDSRELHRFYLIGRSWMKLRRDGEHVEDGAMRALVLGAYALRQMLASAFGQPENRAAASELEDRACSRIAILCSALSELDDAEPEPGLLMTCATVGGFPRSTVPSPIGLASRIRQSILLTQTAALREQVLSDTR